MKTVAALPKVILISLAVAAIAYACTFLVKPTYQSEEVFYFPQAQSESSPLEMLKNGNGSDGSVSLLNGALASPLVGAGPQTASGIVTSHTAIRSCVDDLSLDHQWGLTKNEAYDRLDKWADAKIDKNGMLVVSTLAETPDQAVLILNNLQAYLDARSAALTVNVSRSNRQYLEKRVSNAEQEVDKIQNRLVATMETAPYADINDLMKSYMQARANLQQAEVSQGAAESKLAVLEADTKRIAAGGKSYAENLVALQTLNANVKTLTDELQTRRLALTDAIANFTKDSPEYRNAVRNVQNAESVSKDVFKASQSKFLNGLTPELIQARAELSALKSSTSKFETIMTGYEKNVVEAPKQFASVQRMRMEFDAAMKAYGMLRQQLELAKLAESRDPSRFAVIDPPYPNPKPVGPRRGLISAVVFILAGLVQLALMSLRDETDDYSDGNPELNGHAKGRKESARAVAEDPTGSVERKA